MHERDEYIPFYRLCRYVYSITNQLVIAMNVVQIVLVKLFDPDQ